MREIKIVVILLIALCTFSFTGCAEIHRAVVKRQNQAKEAEVEKQKKLDAAEAEKQRKLDDEKQQQLKQQQIKVHKKQAESVYDDLVNDKSNNYDKIALAHFHYEKLAKECPHDAEIAKRWAELELKYLKARANRAYLECVKTGSGYEDAFDLYLDLAMKHPENATFIARREELRNKMVEAEKELMRKKAEKARQEKIRQEEKIKQLILKAKSQKSRTLVFKGLYIGMPIYETLKILKAQCKASSNDFRIEKGHDESLYLYSDQRYFGTSDNKTFLTSLTLKRDLIDQLFHTKGMTWSRFMQQFINSYNIPELKYERDFSRYGVVDDIYSYDSPQGYQIKFVEDYYNTKRGLVKGAEYIELRKTGRVSDAKFD